MAAPAHLIRLRLAEPDHCRVSTRERLSHITRHMTRSSATLSSDMSSTVLGHPHCR